MDYEAAAKKVIKDSHYVTIATVTPDGLPWNSPVIFATDDEYNFYWTSYSSAEHSKNIQINPNVFLVFYNSTTSSEETDGVYIQASVSEVIDQDELLRAIKVVYTKKQKTFPVVDQFQGASKKRMYKAVLQQAWINPGTDKNKNLMDPRIKIELV